MYAVGNTTRLVVPTSVSKESDNVILWAKEEHDHVALDFDVLEQKMLKQSLFA